MGESQGGVSAEVDQSAAAGLLWLSEGKGDHCGNVAGDPPEGFLYSSTEGGQLVTQHVPLLSHLLSDLFVRCG